MALFKLTAYTILFTKVQALTNAQQHFIFLCFFYYNIIIFSKNLAELGIMILRRAAAALIKVLNQL